MRRRRSLDGRGSRARGRPSSGGLGQLPDARGDGRGRRPQLGDSRAAGDGKVPDHHESDRGVRRARKDGPFRGREDGRPGGGQEEAGRRPFGRRLPGASQPHGQQERDAGRTEAYRRTGKAAVRRPRGRPDAARSRSGPLERVFHRGQLARGTERPRAAATGRRADQSRRPGAPARRSRAGTPRTRVVEPGRLPATSRGRARDAGAGGEDRRAPGSSVLGKRSSAVHAGRGRRRRASPERRCRGPARTLGGRPPARLRLGPGRRGRGLLERGPGGRALGDGRPSGRSARAVRRAASSARMDDPFRRDPERRPQRLGVRSNLRRTRRGSDPRGVADQRAPLPPGIGPGRRQVVALPVGRPSESRQGIARTLPKRPAAPPRRSNGPVGRDLGRSASPRRHRPGAKTDGARLGPFGPGLGLAGAPENRRGRAVAGSAPSRRGRRKRRRLRSRRAGRGRGHDGDRDCGLRVSPLERWAGRDARHGRRGPEARRMPLRPGRPAGGAFLPGRAAMAGQSPGRRRRHPRRRPLQQGDRAPGQPGTGERGASGVVLERCGPGAGASFRASLLFGLDWRRMAGAPPPRRIPRKRPRFRGRAVPQVGQKPACAQPSARRATALGGRAPRPGAAGRWESWRANSPRSAATCPCANS